MTQMQRTSFFSNFWSLTITITNIKSPVTYSRPTLNAFIYETYQTDSLAVAQLRPP